MVLQPIRWIKLKRGLKLNVDAAYLPGKASGDAILRNELGVFIGAISFPMVTCSNLHVELLALLRATTWAINEGFGSFQVECDAKEIVDYVSGRKRDRWMEEIDGFRRLCFRKGIRFRHILREVNELAHLLARLSSAHFRHWSDLNLLPGPVKSAATLDLFGLPSFRFMT
ncbi:unnamed protein product [Cuscuta europaea]|nr:unnamed protein product [Cuscuta europaea]